MSKNNLSAKGESAFGKQNDSIYDKYRQSLEMPHLTDEEIEKNIRPHILLLARTICEHVWGKEFY